MANEGENPAAATPTASKPCPNPFNDQSPISIKSQNSSSHPKDDAHLSSPAPKISHNPEQFILSVAAKIAIQPLQYSDSDVWGVLTAISDKARKRHQGMNMLLTSDEHCIGRLVEDTRFQIASPAVSAYHCKIYRKRAFSEDVENPSNFCGSVFLKDYSTNGTYINCTKLNKSSSEAALCHGDIISIAFAPQDERAFAFVFREVKQYSSTADGACLKRKAEDTSSENKRLKGIGLGALEGPISLDDFRSLQRSNVELRRQLEDQVVTIESLRSENHAVIERHEIEMKDLKESISESYLGKLKELQHLLEAKEKELMDSNRTTCEQKHTLEDLNERLGATMQSCVEANEIINSQKGSMVELKALLDEERDQRREEREKAVADLKSSIQRIQAEAQEEIRRLSDASTKREKKQQEVINKLQESEEERCLLVEVLRSKLEDTRQKLVISENKVRQLEAQVREEQLASSTRRKRIDELEFETRRLRKELESEKAAREEAWAKVSALELEINAAMRDLDFERRRLKGARERIMLRETQLRAFYSTTEEIQILFAKQQKQLKAMQRTLEDEENYTNASLDIDLNINPDDGNTRRFLDKGKEVQNQCSNAAAKAGSSTSSRSHHKDHLKTSSDEASITEKHDCNIRNQGDGDDTQEVEYVGAERTVKGGFGSDIDGVGTAPIFDIDTVENDKNNETEGAGTAPSFEGDLLATERVIETESPGHLADGDINMNKHNAVGEDTMQLDEDTHLEAMEQAPPHENLHDSQTNDALGVVNTADTQVGCSIRTSDLLASEVPGSWAHSTAPSVHLENDSPKSKDYQEGVAALHDSGGSVADSHQALSGMIKIVAPELKEQFGGVRDPKGPEIVITSDSDTQGCSDGDDNNGVNSGDESDAETIGSGRSNKDMEPHCAMEEDDEATQEDSSG